MARLHPQRDKRWLWCAGVLLCWATAAQAGTVPEPESPIQEMTLERLIDETLRRSPALQAKKRAYEAARARAVVAWLPDDPMVGVDVEGQGRFFDFGSRMNNEYMLSQTIPFPTTLLLRAQVASREAQMAFRRYKEEERDVVWHVEQPFHELHLAQKTVAALEETRQLAQKLVSAAQARYESNQGSQQDLLKAQIEQAKVAVELFNWNEKAYIAQAHFSHLMDRPLDTRYLIAEDPPGPMPTLSHAELEQLALRVRPELKALEIGIKQAKASRALAVTSWLPEITGRLEARQFRGERGTQEHDTFLGVTVPVWSLFKGVGGEWRAAGKEVQEAEALYIEMKNEVFLAIHEASSKVKAAANAVRAYETLMLPQAHQQVEVTLAAYEAGREDFLALVDAQRTLKDTQIAYYGVRADYELGLSDLRLAIGGPWASDGPGAPAPTVAESSNPSGGTP